MPISVTDSGHHVHVVLILRIGDIVQSLLDRMQDKFVSCCATTAINVLQRAARIDARQKVERKTDSGREAREKKADASFH